MFAPKMELQTKAIIFFSQPIDKSTTGLVLLGKMFRYERSSETRKIARFPGVLAVIPALSS
jgi:hypothetical protein